MHLVDGRLRRVSRDGVVGAPAGVLEDHGCVAAGFLDLLQATGDPVWLERAGLLLDTALERFAADDGGFFDTADDAEALVARPRDPSDNASPAGLSAMVHALSTYAALTGSGRHRDAAEAALATVAADRRAGGPVRRLVARGGGGDARTVRWRSRSSVRRVTTGMPWSVGRDGTWVRWSWSRTVRWTSIPLLEGRHARRRSGGGVRLSRVRLRAPGHRRAGP